MAVLFIVLAAFVSNARLEMAESSIPITADSSFLLDASTATAGKQEVAAALGRIAEDADVAIGLVSLEPGGFSSARLLLTFGSAVPPVDSNRVWALPERNGGLAPFDSDGASPVDGQFAVWGGDITEQVRSWGLDHGVSVEPAPALPALTMTGTALLTGSAYAPLLALMLALLVLLLVSAGRETRANTQKFLNGVSTLRLAGENALRTSATVLLPMVVIATAAAVIVALRSGPHFLPDYLLGLAHLVVPCTLVLAVCSIALTVVTWPDASTIADRAVGMPALRWATEATKIMAVGMALVLLPLTISGLLRAEQMRDEANLWQRFDRAVAVNSFGTIAGSSDDAAVGDSFREMLRSVDDRSMLVMDLMPAAGLPHELLGDAFDAVVVVDREYLAAATEETDISTVVEPIDASTLPSELAAALETTLALQLADRAGEVPAFEQLETARLAPDVVLPVITGRYLEAMILPDDPLLLIVDNPGTAFTPAFLLAATSTFGVLFSDADTLKTALSSSGLGESALGLDYVATSGLLDLQSRQLAATYSAIAVIVLLAAMVVSQWTSARSFVLGHARRFLPLALHGHRAPRALRGRLVWEGALIVGLWVVSTVVAAASGAPPSTIAITGCIALAAMLLTFVLHGRAFRSIVQRAIARQTI